MVTTSVNPDLASDRQAVEWYLQQLLGPPSLADVGVVPQAMRYAVLGCGQRIRPVLALRVARLLGADGPHVGRAAAAVELLHCASLVVDDLPCMDDEQERRGQPTAHVAFGESTAVLAAFALVSLAARSVIDLNCPADTLVRLVRFQAELLGMLDCSALIAGQALDLQLAGESREEHRDNLNELKTVPLFRLAVRAGMLFGDPTPRQEQALRRFGQHFGMAFQMVDDYLDDEAESMDPFCAQLTAARESLAPFGARARELEGLLQYLHARAWQKHHCHR